MSKCQNLGGFPLIKDSLKCISFMSMFKKNDLNLTILNLPMPANRFKTSDWSML